MNTSKHSHRTVTWFVSVVLVFGLLLTGCTSKPTSTSSSSELSSSASNSVSTTTGSVANPMADTIFAIEGEYILLQITPPDDDTNYSILEADGKIIALSDKGTLTFLDGLTGASYHFESLEGEVRNVENCKYKEYSFRIVYKDGHVEYRNAVQPEEIETINLPETLRQRYLAELNGAVNPAYVTYDVDPDGDVSVFIENGNLLYWKDGKVTEILKSDIPTSEIKDYVDGVDVQYIYPTIMNNGNQIWVDIYLPSGSSGQGQDFTAGLLILDTETGNCHWFFYLFDWFSPGSTVVDDTNIVGLSYPDTDNNPSRPIRLNVETLEVQKGLYYSEPLTPNDSDYHFEYYSHNSQQKVDNGYTMNVLFNDDETPLLSVNAPTDTMYLSGMSEHYIFVLLRDSALNLSYRLAIRYR